jgi:histone H3/H4
MDYSKYVVELQKKPNSYLSLTNYILTDESKVVLSNMVNLVIEKLMDKANMLMRYAKINTINENVIKTSVNFVYLAELRKGANIKLKEEMEKYNNRKDITRSEMFPGIEQIENNMMELSIFKKKTETAAIALIAVLDYIFSEILELAGNVASDNQRNEIYPLDMRFAIYNDDELSYIFAGTIIIPGVISNFSEPIELSKPIEKKLIKSPVKKESSSKESEEVKSVSKKKKPKTVTKKKIVKSK